jgi:predicted outer membrane lipoprotein
MSPLVELATIAAIVLALVAVVSGQVLTRSVVAGHAAIAAFGLAALGAGAGVLALCFVIVGLLGLAILQLFGWMLVDIDHDHLPPPRPSTLAARLLALAVFALALAALVRAALRRGELGSPPGLAPTPTAFDPASLGSYFLGSGGELAIVLGLLLAAALLTALWLLRDEEGVDAG